MRSQPVLGQGGVVGRVRQRRAERGSGQLGLAPVAGGDVLAVRPDLADGAIRAQSAGVGIDDPQQLCHRRLIPQQRRPARFAHGSAPCQLIAVELDDLGYSARAAAGDVDGRLGKAVGRQHHLGTKSDWAEMFVEPDQCLRVDAFRSVDDAEHSAEIKAVELGVGGPTRGEVEREVGCTRPRSRVAAHGRAAIAPGGSGTRSGSSDRPGDR